MASASSTIDKLRNTAWVARASFGERRIAWRPPAELARLQAARVRSLVRFAYDHVPHYRDGMRAQGIVPDGIRDAADLARLPFVDKLELTLHPDRFSPPGAEERDGLTLVSSGTSGLRRRFRHDRRSILESLAAGRRQRLALAPLVGREAGYREAVVNRPGSASTQIREYIESRTVPIPGVELERLVLTPWLPYDELLARLADFRPTVIQGIGSHLGAFYRWMHATGATPCRPRAITYGADAMPPHDRALIEREFGIPVISTYQAVEALRIGFECEARQGFHVSVDQVAFRVVDADGRDVAPGGRGAFVLTNLVNRATVVINYRLGDLVTLGDGPCPCGRTLPLIRAIDGRLDDLIARPDGSRIPAIVLISQLQALRGVRQVRVDQLDYDRFEVKLIPMAGVEWDEPSVRASFSDRFGPASQVAIEVVDALPSEASGKTKTFASRVAMP
jgi:phenylacetate-CoA ligase